MEPVSQKKKKKKKSVMHLTINKKYHKVVPGKACDSVIRDMEFPGYLY